MDPYCIGLDIHEKIIVYCIKKADGETIEQGSIQANRNALVKWVQQLPGSWFGAMEATMFTGWIYDFLKPHAKELKVAKPLMLKAISASKKKDDRIDSAKNSGPFTL